MIKLISTLALAGFVLMPSAFANDHTIEVVVENESRITVGTEKVKAAPTVSAVKVGPRLPGTGLPLAVAIVVAGAVALRRK